MRVSTEEIVGETEDICIEFPEIESAPDPGSQRMEIPTHPTRTGAEDGGLGTTSESRTYRRNASLISFRQLKQFQKLPPSGGGGMGDAPVALGGGIMEEESSAASRGKGPERGGSGRSTANQRRALIGGDEGKAGSQSQQKNAAFLGTLLALLLLGLPLLVPTPFHCCPQHTRCLHSFDSS